MSIRRLLPLLCTVLALAGAASARATTPGANGRIVFASGASGNSELYSVGADGSAERRLTWTPQGEQAPAWSPDGTRIAYESDASGRSHIWVMNADGSGQAEISPPADSLVVDSDPAWSPDGTKIAFGSTRAGNWNLWVMDADGSNLRQVSSVFGNDPAWSPDGQQLAYVSSTAIGVVNRDGSNPHAVSAPGAFASGPSWSPDGSRIVFTRNNAAGYPGELSIVNADGSGERQLTSDGLSNARPSWSPDGTQVVFQRTSTPTFGWSLWAIAPDGTGLRQVTSTTNALGPDWGSSQVVPNPSPPSAPTIQIFSPSDGGYYFPGTQVLAFYTCSSYVTFIVSCTGDAPFGTQLDLTAAGTHTFTVSAVDGDGRTATASVTYQVLDLTAPQITFRTPSDGATYDLGSPVTLDFSCDDPNGSGVAFCFGDRPNGAPLDTSQAGSHTFTVRTADNAGNYREATATYDVVEPTHPPSIVISSPADGAAYTLGATVLASYSCSASSKVVACDGTVADGAAIDTGSIGTKSFAVHAADANGKSASLTNTYSVIYAFSGFGTPVSASGSIDTAKAGDATPLKFSLSGDQGLGVVTRASWQPASCADWSAQGAAAAGRVTLSYSASSDRYLALADTDSRWKKSCRTLDLELADGTHHTVHVHFTN